MYRLTLITTWLLCFAINASAGVLVLEPSSGRYSIKPTLSEAATDPDTAGKTIIVTSALSAVQSNISSATLHSWPSNRTLKVERGGSINPTTKFVGLPYAEAWWFGATADGVTNDTVKVHLARDAVDGGKLYFPAGTYRGNFVFGNNLKIIGEGRTKTIFKATSTASPIVHFNETDTSGYYYLGGEDFSVGCEGTAEVGVKIGTQASGPNLGTATYGHLSRVDITSCVDNLYLKDTVGFVLDDIYSVSASNAALKVGFNDIVTAVTIKNSRFRLSKYGAYLYGGAIMKFDNVVFENNTHYGAWINSGSSSGAREFSFDTCWFEGNGTVNTSLGNNVADAASIWIDVDSTMATNRSDSSIKFHNCNITSDSDGAGTQHAYNVYLLRGSEIIFDNCSFQGDADNRLTSSQLFYNTVAGGTGYAFATLRQCGTVGVSTNHAPSPDTYSTFPALTSSASGTISQGYKYEYFYLGYPYTNVKTTGFSWQVATGTDITSISGNGAVYTTISLAGAATSSTLHNDGGAFNTTNGKFTAPGPGTYYFDIKWPITNFDTMTSATVSFNVANGTIYTTNVYNVTGNTTGVVQTLGGSIVLNLNAGDTVIGQIAVAGGAGNTAAIYRGSSLFSFTGRQLK